MFIAAPSPVESPHAKRHAPSSGASGVIFASAISGITVYSANVERAHEVADRLAVAREPRRAVGQEALVLLLADREAEVRARGSRQWTHSRHWGEKSVTTWSPGASERDALADPLDDARALVAEHGRRVPGRVGAGGRVEVGVADAARDEPHEHLARARLGEVDLLNRERRTELLEHGGADLHARRS